jgi:hypothetical protein
VRLLGEEVLPELRKADRLAGETDPSVVAATA